MAGPAEAPLPASQTEVEELVEQYEGKTRHPGGLAGRLITAALVVMSLYHLWATTANIITQIHRTIHLLFVLTLAFLLYPGWRGAYRRIQVLDLLLAAAAVVSLGYVFVDFDAFVYRSVVPNRWDLIFGVTTILLILEATRRTVGKALLVVVVAFLVYAFAGPFLPAPWTHRGYDLSRLVGQLYMTLEGIFGIPLAVSSTFIILFTIYGSFLDQSGAGKFFVDLAFALTGRRRTGAGQAVTVASFLLGGPSGSGVATTVTVGAIAYPLLKKAGYDRESAGGLLSAGGIGAVISPPILGAAAFIIAEILKISYLDVLIMAIIPTALYYLAIFLMIELDARRFALRHVEIATENPVRLALRYWYLLSSLVVIPAFMVYGFTAIKAVFWATIVAWLASYLRRDTALGPGKLVAALANGSRQVLNIGVTTAAAGIIVGVTNLTGLGLKLSDIIISLAGGSLILTLIYAALALWVLGLALPITATYIIAAVTVAPALTKLGVHELAAHMFIFYYAVLSEVSPPVGLSPMAASALTGGNPFKTMLLAWKYTLPAFVVPFMFTVHPDGMGLLLRAPVADVIKVTITASAGLGAMAAGVNGWLLRRATLLERAVLVAAGLLLIYPAATLDLLALAAVAGVAGVQWFSRKPAPQSP
ncbi:MAG: TRAP transporter fused permease subunit [Armatimonadota bacterium]|nr:TRAP transporter fused permease subunit [Armatimonadota bacterium]MDR7450674.1 TRAP transporter fused permease subunit [Armatimonadota bacterium]MDR7466030.1 TRAP transporter fused permease subunit [Armatimonadota bacterium]MDR7493933.1 TRAP transporter fused permease subunit [Armatimonadota bacterium]MDR7504038.1 TRAP transporter fused permease subunit [Armatimonadota bacterium]